MLKQIGSLFTPSLLWGLFALSVPGTSPADERSGVSCADCAKYSGAYSIENTTGVTIYYSYRWGDQHPWKQMTLPSGRVETHSYPLGENPSARVPTPFVRFDYIAGDHRYTPREYRMSFYSVGYAGYGARANTAQPKRYFFKFSPDGRTLALLAR